MGLYADYYGPHDGGNIDCHCCGKVFQPSAIDRIGGVVCPHCNGTSHLHPVHINRLLAHGVRASGGPFEHRPDDSGVCRVCGYQLGDNPPGCPAAVELAVYEAGKPLTNAWDFRSAAKELHAMLTPAEVEVG